MLFMPMLHVRNIGDSRILMQPIQERDENELDGGMRSQAELIAPGRSFGGLILSALAVLGLAYVAITGGSGSDGSESDGSGSDEPPSTTVPTSAPISTIVPAPMAGPGNPPRVEGTLRSGAPFEVFESSPGVLCAVFPDDATYPVHAVPMADVARVDAPEFCHLELVTGSGAAVLDETLIFGYLRPGAASASLRYRTGGTGNDGIRVERSARFFALPIRADDPYRLQYRTEEFDLVEEAPLVPPRGGPSQTAADAAGDDVPPSIAQLPFNRRVDIIDEWSYSSNGPYAWSRPELDDSTEGAADWAELLLLDDTGTEILHAVPLPNIELRARVSTDDALYVIGEQVEVRGGSAFDRGEIRLPVTVVRFDHRTGASFVRVFPQATVSSEPMVAAVAARDGWTTGPSGVEIRADSIAAANGVVLVEPFGAGGPLVALDPDTLLPLEPR